MMHFAESIFELYTINTPVQDLCDVFKIQCYDCLELVSSITSSKPVKNHDLLLLDFSKDFDKVSYQRLLYKLSHYGINGPLFNWIKECLFNRQQKVILDGANSSSSQALSGVPHGSVLRPLYSFCFVSMTFQVKYPLLLDFMPMMSSFIDILILMKMYIKLQEDLVKLTIATFHGCCWLLLPKVENV